MEALGFVFFAAALITLAREIITRRALERELRVHRANTMGFDSFEQAAREAHRAIDYVDRERPFLKRRV